MFANLVVHRLLLPVIKRVRIFKKMDKMTTVGTTAFIAYIFEGIIVGKSKINEIFIPTFQGLFMDE